MDFCLEGIYVVLEMLYVMWYLSERTFVMDEVPKIKKVTPWDGKDAVLEVDEFPLDELDL